MERALVTGSRGLIGQSCVWLLKANGFHVTGVDNNARGDQYFALDKGFIPDVYPDTELYRDVQDSWSMADVVKSSRPDLVIHCAGQPSHDWSAAHPIEDFKVNALGTLNLLEATRQHAPEASFIFCSTNKVYGDMEWVPLDTGPTRYNAPDFAKGFHGTGISTSPKSPFGCGKTAADLYVQEYGYYYGMKAVSFRLGCVTGKNHRGAELHGFLAYLVQCAKNEDLYRVYGHEGKQVRDNIHADDVASAFLAWHRNPIDYVYDLGGGPERSVSVIEAIHMTEAILGKKMKIEFIREPRKADHRWWVTDISAFRGHYPEWSYKFSIEEIFEELCS